MAEKKDSYLEHLQALVRAKKVTVEEARKALKANFLDRDIDDKGNIYSRNTLDIMKRAADSPEELLELMQGERDLELKNLKYRDVRFDGETSRFVDAFGNYSTEVKNFADMNKVRSQVRKEAKKILGRDSETNKFMKAKSFEDYKKMRDRKIYKAPGTMTEAFDNVEAGIVPTEPKSLAPSRPTQEILTSVVETKNEQPKQMDVEEYIIKKAEERKKKEDDELAKKFGSSGIVELIIKDRV